MAKAEALPLTEDITNYVGVMRRLRDKGMTLRATADFMSKELGRRVTHTMVYRLLRDATALPHEQPDYDEHVKKELIERASLDEELEEGK